MKNLGRVWVLIFLPMMLLSCNEILSPGHYQGALSGREKGAAVSSPVQGSVGIDVSYASGGGTVEVRNPKGQLITPLFLSHLSRGSFELEIPILGPGRFHLAKTESVPAVKCYQGDDRWKAAVCFDEQRFLLTIKDEFGEIAFKLSGDNFPIAPEFKLEKPTILTLEEAIQHALNSNLDTQIGFEHVVQGKYAVTAAYLELVPHLSTNLIWNASPSFITVIATLQALTPFLLPTYWLQARETQYDLKIREDAQLILKADLASIVEQSSLAFDRDQEIGSVQDEVLGILADKLDGITNLERIGLLPRGASDVLSSLMEKVRGNREKIVQLVRDDRYLISQSTGFHNPDGLKKVIVPPFNFDLSPGAFKPIVNADFAKDASKYSFELRQITYLEHINGLKETELYFAWIDPTGDPKSGLGLNTYPLVKISESQLKELGLKRELTEETLYQNAYRVADLYNSSLELVKQAVEHHFQTPPNLEADIDAIISQNWDSQKLIECVDGYISRRVGDIANIADYRIAQSKVDRFLLSGTYQYLLPKLEETDLNPSNVQPSK